MSRSRNFCFTLNNYTDDEINWLENDFLNNCNYFIYGKEICPSTGTPHLQCYVNLKNPKSFNGLKKLLGNRYSIRQCNGTPKQNYDYCSKDGDFKEFGELPKQGKRNDLEDIYDMIKENKSILDISNNHPASYIRYHRGIEKLKSLQLTKRNWEMDVRIYWGKSGVGKTKAVYDEFDINDIYEKPVGKWWDGYIGQKVVLIDDFDPQNCYDLQFDFYLKLLDRYPLLVEYKGGFANFCSKIIIFTSNFDPETWFPNKANRIAFFRRCTEIVHRSDEVILDSSSVPGDSVPPINGDPPVSLRDASENIPVKLKRCNAFLL